MSIPFINKYAQTQIADFVQQSFTLKAESERLLNVAKRAVESPLSKMKTQVWLT
jgi:hypothetical protein